MLNILIKQNEYKQLVIAGAAISDATVTINSLLEKLDISRNTFNRYLITINHDLISAVDTSLSINSDGTSLTLINPNDLQPPNIFIRLIKYYLNDSTGFKLLMILSQQNKIASDKLLDNLSISHSYLNKVIKQLNTSLDNVAVKIIQRNKNVFFEGDELDIIILLISLRLSLWPFAKNTDYIHQDYKKFSLLEPNLIVPLNNLERARLGHIEQVFIQRKETIHTITINDPDIYDALEIITNYYDITQPDTFLDKDAILLMNYLCRLLCPPIDSTTNRIALAKLFTRNPSKLTQEGLILDSYLRNNILPAESRESDKYHLHTYQGMLSFISIHLIQCNFLDILTIRSTTVHDFYIYNQPNFIKTREAINSDIPFKYDKTKENFSQNTDYFTSGVYTVLREYRSASIKVILDFKYRLTFERYLKQRLHETFSEQMIEYVDHSTEADIIITDTFIEVPETQASFVFVDPNSTFAMKELLKILLNIYTQKLQ